MTDTKFKLKGNKQLKRLALILAVCMPFLLYFSLVYGWTIWTILSSALIIAGMLLILI